MRYAFRHDHIWQSAKPIQEVKLADNSAERDLYESLAEIYSIIITLDALEKAYLRDSIKESEYTETCDRLLRQYKSNLADDSVHAAFGDLERFKAEWDVCTLSVTAQHMWTPLTPIAVGSAKSNGAAENWPASNHRGCSDPDWISAASHIKLSHAQQWCWGSQRISHCIRIRELHHPVRCGPDEHSVQGYIAPDPGRHHPGGKQGHRPRLRE